MRNIRALQRCEPESHLADYSNNAYRKLFNQDK